MFRKSWQMLLCVNAVYIFSNAKIQLFFNLQGISNDLKNVNHPRACNKKRLKPSIDKRFSLYYYETTINYDIGSLPFAGL